MDFKQTVYSSRRILTELIRLRLSHSPKDIRSLVVESALRLLRGDVSNSNMPCICHVHNRAPPLFALGSLQCL